MFSGEIKFPAGLEFIPNTFGLDVGDSTNIMLFVIISSVVLASILRLALLYLISKFSFQLFHHLTCDLYDLLMTQRYQNFITRNTSDYLSYFQKIDELAYSYIAFLNFISAMIISCIVCTFLVLLLPGMVTLGLGIIVFSYFIFVMSFKPLLYRNSIQLSKSISSKNNILLNSINAFIESRFFNVVDYFAAKVQEYDAKLKSAQVSNNVISPTPRFLVEPIAYLVLGLVAYLLTLQSSQTNALAAVATVALAMQRIMPLMQQAFVGWSIYAGKREIFSEIISFHKDLVRSNKPRQQNDSTGKITLSQIKNVKVKNVSLLKQDNSVLLSKVNLCVPTGASVALIGPSGAGKTSLLRAMTGLIDVYHGHVCLDQMQIDEIHDDQLIQILGVIPQDSILVDGTVNENLFLGAEESISVGSRKILIEMGLIPPDSNPTMLLGFLHTRISELSGGQRQRIGLARALLHKKKFLFCDEITSSLDFETANKVMKLVTSLKYCDSVFCIVHDKRLLKYFDYIYSIEDGTIISK